MHIQVAQNFTFAPTVEVAVPHQGEFTGDVYGPSVFVRPTSDSGHMWMITADEAEDLAHKLLAAAKEARELFPTD